MGYRFFVRTIDARHILALSFSALIMGLAGGVFYREFTKFHDFKAASHLSKLHVHTLVLGFLMLLVLHLIARQMRPADLIRLKRPLMIYLAGLTFTIVNMTVLGIYEVVGQNAPVIPVAALAGTSGLGISHWLSG